jgi:hypothetical protein
MGDGWGSGMGMGMVCWVASQSVSLMARSPLSKATFACNVESRALRDDAVIAGMPSLSVA